MSGILVSQEFVQVEWADRPASIVISQECIQVEYTLKLVGTSDINTEIVGVYGEVKPEYTYVKSTHEFEDFDVQADFVLCSGIEPVCGVEIAFEINKDNRFYIRSSIISDNNVFICNFVDEGVSHVFVVSGTNDYGKLRISRYVDNVKVYYKDGLDDTWTTLESYSKFNTSKGNVLLGFYSSFSFNSSATLDTFIINFEKSCSDCLFYIFDDFCGVNGDFYNQDLWTGSTSNVRIYNNKLHMTYTNMYTYVDTKYVPIGDFNVQVDFSIGNNETSEYWSTSLIIYFKNGSRFDIRFYYAGSPHYKTYYSAGIYYDSDDTSGKFRIIKKGNTFSSYFLQGTYWFHLTDWYLTADTEVDYIRLEHNSWLDSPKFECYFDNFKINNDFDFYDDVRIDGDYSYVDGNYIKLGGGSVRTNKVIRSVNAITFEWSVTIEDYSSSDNAGFVVCNTPFRSGYSDHSGESIHVVYYNGVFSLNVDGYAHYYIIGSNYYLFYPVYGKPYIIGIKFIPGTGTIIYWEGPTNGYFVLDYIINGDLYAWCGNQYGYGTYGTQVTRVHRFRCFEDKPLYKELKNDWLFSVGINDTFKAQDGRGPNLERWVVTGDPKTHNDSLKIIAYNGDKIQSKTFFCAPFEIVLDYNNLSFDFTTGFALSLNVEAYDSYKDTIFGVSKFKVGYSGGPASWVNYYCSGSSGNSSIYHTSDVSSRKLKIVNDGRNIQYFLSDNSSWITVLSQSCDKQYYYKISIEGTSPGVIAHLDNITIDSEEFMTPTDAVALIPTAWKFSPTNKAYQNITYINLNELVDKCRYFSIDTVAKIDDSMFLSYIEMDKDLVNFDGAKVVGDGYVTLISAMDVASNGEIIYVLPGTYSLGGYTITKDIIIVGIGDYKDVIITINSASVRLDGCEVIFKNVTVVNQLSNGSIGFKTQGDEISYFTMDNCKYSSLNYDTQMFRGEGTKGYYVYFRHSYLYFQSNYMLASVDDPYKTIILDIFDCRIQYSSNTYLFKGNDNYQIRSEIYSNSYKYEPKVINTIPVFVLFSPHNDTNIYLSTPKGLEKTVTSKENRFNYLSFGNTLGGVTFYGGDNNYYFSEYVIPLVDNSFRLFTQGYVDTIRVFDRYQTHNETLNNINIVDNLGIDLKLAHNNTVVDYRIYEPINQYNSSLMLGRNTPSIVDEFIWSKAIISSSDLLAYYNGYLGKLGYLGCGIIPDDVKYKFFIDLGSVIGIGSLIQPSDHNFSNITYYSDDVSEPGLLSTVCSLSQARWCVLSNNIEQNVSDLTPGTFSIFPVINGCDGSKWTYTGESGYIDSLPGSVLNVSSSLTSVYNVKWKRNKTDINDYMISHFSEPLIIDLKLFGGGKCDKIVIKSGYNVGTEYAGYISKCSIVIDGVTMFNIENNINSTITAEFDSVSFTTIELIVYEVKQVPEFYFNGVCLSGDTLFVNYIKVLSSSTSRKFDTTLCNVYELYKPLKLKDINTSKIGSCSLDYYFDTSYVDGCMSPFNLDLDNLPSSEFVSILSRSDTLCDCGFTINEYGLSVLNESITRSIKSWTIYFGDAELYEEFFYIKGNSTSIGVKFFKNTDFEIGTYNESFGTDIAWTITDELVVRIYSSNNIDDFYLCIGDRENSIYYRWDFNLVSGWNDFRFNFYGDNVTKYVSGIITEGLLFKNLIIFNVWFGGTYLYNSGFVVLDNLFVDKSTIYNVLSSKEDAFYIPIYFESACGSIQMDFVTFWDNKGKILEDMLSDKVLLSVFCDSLSFSLVNKTLGEFVLGVYSYEQSIKTVKSFGKARNFEVNDKLKLKLNWYCDKGYFVSELYINGMLVGKIEFNYIELNKLKVTGIIVGGGSVYISQIYNSLSLCGKVSYIKVYSDTVESKLINDRLLIKVDGEYKDLVKNSPLSIGEIEPGNFIKLPVRYEGKSKRLNELNLKLRWAGIY